jgi:hypothetical protein
MLISLIVEIVVVALVYWLVSLLPLPAPAPLILKVIFILILIFIVLGAFGILGSNPRLI